MTEEGARTFSGFEAFERQNRSLSGSPFCGFSDQEQDQISAAAAQQRKRLIQHAQSKNISEDTLSHQFLAPGPVLQTSASNMTGAPISTLRQWFPLLHAMPDPMLANTDLPTLMALNKSLQPQSQSSSGDPLSHVAEIMAAAAAKISGSMSRQEDDPAVTMAKTLEILRANPAAVAAGQDDRCHILHPARFLGGYVCSAKRAWLTAREVLGLEGIPPLSNYDLSAIGLGGCVTMRGFKEIHQPGSPHLTLKLFSSSNMGSSTGATKRLTLADGDTSVNIGDNMKEIHDLNEFKLAVRAMCRTAQLVMPWNMAFNSIDGFLHNTNYGYAELHGRSNRAAILTDFVNYMLGLNAAAWVQKEEFKNSGEIKTIFGEWFGSRPASLLVQGDINNSSRSSCQQSSSKEYYNR